MLALRKIFEARRKRRNSTSPPVTSEGPKEDSNFPAATDDLGRAEQVFKSIKDIITRTTHYNEQTVEYTDLLSYLNFIAAKHITQMPSRGGHWYLILTKARFFGQQVYLFGQQVESCTAGGENLARAVLVCCQFLLETGYAHAAALLPIFITLSELATLLYAVRQVRDLEKMPIAIKENAVDILCDLANLTGSIVAHYSQKIASLGAGQSVVIDLHQSIGNQITNIWRVKQELYDQIWSHSLGKRYFSLSLSDLQKKLDSAPLDSMYRALSGEVTNSFEHSEVHCYWFSEILYSFLESNVQVLSITGPAGSGKSVMAKWLRDKLLTASDEKIYITLNFEFAADTPGAATALSCVKSLLTQLLECNVGNIALLEPVIIAYEDYAGHRSSEKLEASLWNALRTGLVATQQGSTPILIITDGDDGIVGGDRAAIAFHNALRTSTSNVPGVRIITFSRPESYLSNGCRHIRITDRDIQRDIRAYFDQILLKSEYFDKLSPKMRHDLVGELLENANGSFLWAFYAGRLLQSASLESYQKLKDSITSDISSVLQATVSENRLRSDDMLGTILSYMLVATRPLTVEEFSQLLAVNVPKRSMDKDAIDFAKWVPGRCGDLIIIWRGSLHFRSSIVRSYLLQQAGKTLCTLQDAHFKLMMRTLVYTRLHVRTDRDPTLVNLGDSIANEFAASYELLPYAVQSWVVHFREAGLVDSTGAVVMRTHEFMDIASIFPDTVTFAQLERAWLHRNHSVPDPIVLHHLAYKVREAIFGRVHITVLQSLITLGSAHRHTNTSNIDSLSYLIQAIRLAIALVSRTSVIVADCARLFLSWTENTRTTERTEIVTYREEVLGIMITIYRAKYGFHSDEVIHWLKELAQLYMDIREEERATPIRREVYEAIKTRHGEKSEEAREICRAFGAIDVVFTVGHDLCSLDVLIYNMDENEVVEKMNITMALQLAQSYMTRGKFSLADRVYLALWRQISVLCTDDSDIDVQTAKVQVMLAYVTFLRRMNRVREALDISVGFWVSNEDFDM
ncbi:hypothetical protein B0I35DRAFT_476518 [Stachybotrys elegans]|uniref:Nephrocystin 3-like N-terminal domain-containing protein n=1 Tax=Stachybotrys elegans TaxID=80388 RepID=A0A8K0SVD4_9HYPO|nr:hypothetical protein B0I35DRAFT_476518 [Stachybotrys elegans]